MLRKRKILITILLLLIALLFYGIQWYRGSKFRYFLALETNNWPTVISLINKGIDPSTENGYGYNAMCWAIYNAPIETLQILVKSGVPFDKIGSRGRAPILLAAEEKRWDVVNWLLGLYDISECPEVGQPLLLIAINNGNLELASQLIQKGISPTFYSKDGFTPLHVALRSLKCRENRNTCYAMVQLLVENGADIYALSKPDFSTSDSFVGIRKESESKRIPYPHSPLDLVKEMNDETLSAIIKRRDPNKANFL